MKVTQQPHDLGKACGKDRWLGPTEALEQDIQRVSDTRLWQFHTAASMVLLDYARERLSRTGYVRRWTIRRGSYPTVMAWRCLRKMRMSCGSGDSIANGK